MSQVFAGIDLGGTFVKTALVSEDGQILAKTSLPSEGDKGPDRVMDVMAQSVDRVVDEAKINRSALRACGVGAPGPMNWRTGVVYSPPNLKGWKDVPLSDAMGRRISMPVYVDNDANVACFGEYWSGAGQGVDSMCMLTLGTGVGGGIVVFGRLLRGIDGTAAEVGHLKVQRDGRPCGCGGNGCLESYASVTGLVRTAEEGLSSGVESVLNELKAKGDPITGKRVSEAAEAGDAFARSVIEETGRWIGIGIASLINLLNPERIVIGGGMIDAGEMLFKPMRETAAKEAFDVPAKRAEIVTAALGGDAGVIGAAGCARERYNDQSS